MFMYEWSILQITLHTDQPVLLSSLTFRFLAQSDAKKKYHF